MHLPSPEQLGIALASTGAPADTNWTAGYQRFKELGAVCFRIDKVPQGYRITCLLPTGQPGKEHRIEAEALSETEALRLALNDAERWASTR